MKYSIIDFHKEFPDDSACLSYVFTKRYPDLKGYSRISGRLSFSNGRKQIYPLAGTIFEKTRTPLKLWFYAIYLFSVSKTGISAMELQRQLGVTYKCAWRIGHLIRGLMKQPKGKLFGTVEADETYIGARQKLGAWRKIHQPVVGALQRNGQVKASVIPKKDEHAIIRFLERNVRRRATLYTDHAPVYKTTRRYHHEAVMHSKREYVRGKVHTNSIEGFWSGVKQSLRGTYRGAVSSKYLQNYINERVWTWNHRASPFSSLLEVL